MGSWDVYCAICGGHTGAVHVSRKPRTSGFKRRRAREAAKRKAENIPDTQPVHFSSDTETMEAGKAAGDLPSEEDNGSDPDDDSLCSEEEDSTYDPEILSEKDASWTQVIQVLGCNLKAPSKEKGFVSGVGSYTDYGRVDVRVGEDPNFDTATLDLACYYAYDSSSVVFPFHPCCWELLARCITGGPDVSKLDKDVLYNIMVGLASECSQRLELDYGNPGPQNEQFWGSFPGEEVFAKQPTGDKDFEALVRATISGDEFQLPARDREESRAMVVRIERDAFKMLPYDIIYRITELLPTSSVLALCQASWPVHTLLGDSVEFWGHRIARELPWFYELAPLLETSDLGSRLNLKKILAWAQRVTKPCLGMSGPFLSVANRRRIWGVCEQLAELYRERKPQGKRPSEPESERDVIRNSSRCAHMPYVAGPTPSDGRETVVSVHWVQAWEDLNAEDKRLETTWASDGSLIGIYLAVDGEVRGLCASSERVDTSIVSTAIESGSWITGFVLHLRFSREEIMPVGITVLLSSGAETNHGATEESLSKLPLITEPGFSITGLNSVCGEISGRARFLRLGLIQARRPHVDNRFVRRRESNSDLPRPAPLQGHLWKSSYRASLSMPIWSHPHLRCTKLDNWIAFYYNGAFHNDVVPYEALIWARNPAEARLRVRLQAYLRDGGEMTSKWEGEYVTRDAADICGIRAELMTDSADNSDGTERHNIGARTTPDGEEWVAEDHNCLELNGKIGEVVEVVTVGIVTFPEAIKIRTSLGKEVCWGDIRHENLQELRAPQGSTIVGLVASFARAGNGPTDESYKKISTIGILTMPLGVDTVR